MALTSPRTALGPPCLARNVATSTPAVLHLDTEHGGVAPIGVNHLPSGVMSDAGGALQWVDASGATVNTTLAAGVFVPIAPAELTTDSVGAITVFWHRGASKAP